MVKYLLPSVITQHHKYLTVASHLYVSHSSPFTLPMRGFVNPPTTILEPEPASQASEVLGGVIKVAGGVFKMMR